MITLTQENVTTNVINLISFDFHKDKAICIQYFNSANINTIVV